MFYHAGLSKHFCCNGLCRAGKDSKLLLTVVSLWFMLGDIIPTVSYCTLKHYWNARWESFSLFLPNTESAYILKNRTKCLTDETHGARRRASSSTQQHRCLLVISPAHYTDCRNMYIPRQVQTPTVLNTLPSVERHWPCPEKTQEKLQENLKSSQAPRRQIQMADCRRKK